MNAQATMHTASTEDFTETGEANREPLITILVVEDNDSERWRISAMLTKLGYRVLEAANGDDALSMQLEQPAALVVSDWRMPGMDGLELCRVMKTETDYQSPYFIMLTGMTNPVDLIAGMEMGADDFIAKPCAAEELRVRVQAGARIQNLRQAQEHNNRLMRHLLRRERRAMHRIRDDLALAAEMQQGLLPATFARYDNFSVGTLFRPADEVGGDFFNYFQLGPNHLGFYLLDVTGHGVSAAMLAFSIAYQLTGEGSTTDLLMRKGAHGPEPETPSRVVAALNERFLDRDDRGRHFTMVYGVLDLRDGKGTLCQAGHPHPMLLSSEGSMERLGDSGFPVGMFAEADYRDTAFRLEAGDRIFLCSDGVLDRLSAQHGSDAYLHLAECLSVDSAATADGMIEVMESVLNGEMGQPKSDDDISILTVSRDTA